MEQLKKKDEINKTLYESSLLPEKRLPNKNGKNEEKNNVFIIFILIIARLSIPRHN